jgi:hypothetical protein
LIAKKADDVAYLLAAVIALSFVGRASAVVSQGSKRFNHRGPADVSYRSPLQQPPAPIVARPRCLFAVSGVLLGTEAGVCHWFFETSS